MPVAIELFLDAPSADVVRQLWRGIAEAGISPYLHTSGVRPHLTLAVGDKIDGPAVDAGLRGWATETSPRRVTFAGLGLTPSENANVFLTAVVTSELLELHRKLHDRLAGLLESSWSRYQPGHWVPHCTLAERIPPDLIGRTIAIARTAPLPLDAGLNEIAVVEFSPLLHRSAFPLTG